MVSVSRRLLVVVALLISLVAVSFWPGLLSSALNSAAAILGQATPTPIPPTVTPTPSRTATALPTATATPQPTLTPTNTATASPTDSPSPAPSATPNETTTPEPTATASETDTPLPTATNTPAPTVTKIPTPKPTATHKPATATSLPATAEPAPPTATPEQPAEPIAPPTDTTQPAPTDTPISPALAPTDTPIPAEPAPTDTPQPAPTDTPQPAPTDTPAKPTAPPAKATKTPVRPAHWALTPVNVALDPTRPAHDPSSYEVYIPTASKEHQYYHYTCEFDAAWVVFKTYGFDVSLDDQLALVGIDGSVEPTFKETADGIDIYGGDIGNAYSGNYQENFLSRTTGSAMIKVFQHYGIAAAPVRSRAALEASLRANKLVWIKTTADFKRWVPATWHGPDGRTYKTVLGNDHAVIVEGFNAQVVVIRDVLGPTATNANRIYEYEVTWPTFMAAWGAQDYDGLALTRP